MNTQRNVFDNSTSTDRFADLNIGPPLELSVGPASRQAFSDWLDQELLELMDRFSADITPNSLRNSLRRDR